ncbi:DUF3656 domain-containing protein [Clostridium sp. OS1-26]|uniref:DUF3656 domain-containing U32 family peptidase n=1 Tax=Clostridium sp. OS1-26 TaxID=3070681 RepID=UPI0027E0EF8F|nr:DUF3656 domain-containing protein [Clostridium sp. OS1-26]WML35813.1 DUF3656 domain-containing protein [Clostridium sp. OS1-26]
MRRIELLAPAGSIESLYAAVQAGADAVYLGGNKFSARAYASNFDDENMIKAVQYCHLYNVKVYITINTILKENEINEALEYAKLLYKIGVDALIIQDMGFASLVRKHLPEFELHASTQMTIHNAEGALLLTNLGFKRVVLSRELSIDEIRYISKDLGVETEIFVHGALCVCYSGQCLMSSMIGGRSGNRGRCAQPCRLPYTIIDKKNKSEKKGYILSPKDICTVENVKEIIESGTASLKIEGRMKRPEYVAGVVQAYRKAIDEYYKSSPGENLDYSKGFDLEHEKKKLMQLFNREGFSRAYLFGNTGKDMMAYSFPKNTGVELGKVQKDLTLVLKENVSLKDGIRSGENGFIISKILKNGKEVDEAFKGDKIKLLPQEYKNGDVLFKTSDSRLLKELETFYKNAFERKMDLELKVKFKVGEPIELSTSYKDNTFEVKGEIVQKAIKRPLDRERIIESLSKTGDIPFKFTEIDFVGFEEGFLPVSSINEIRRELLTKIEEHILTSDNKDKLVKLEKDKNKLERENNSENNNLAINNAKTNYSEIPNTIIFLNNEEHVRAFLKSDFQYAAINPFSNLGFNCLDKLKGKKVFFKIPNIIKSEFNYICDSIESRLTDIEGLITANMGIIHKFSKNTKILGDYKLNIFNSYALDFYNKFLCGNCLSVELNRKELSDIVKKDKSPTQILVYGKVELMVSEYCPIGSVFGGKSACKDCSRACEKGQFVLKDRKGEEFVLKNDRFCRSYIYNNVPTNLISNIRELRTMGIRSYRVDLIDESYDEAKRILESVKEECWKDDLSKFTRGHYKRGVE